MMNYREYGNSRNGHRYVIVVHGGPGAPGSAAGLARPLGGAFSVYEPFQRRRDDRPLTVATHVADLQQFIEQHCGGVRPAVVGHSWGAMLALAHAAEHPQAVAGIALVGCGTFDTKARARFEQLREERSYSYDPVEPRKLDQPFDETGHRESWADMLRCQAEGLYPAAFAAITAPTIMLHGECDPHPGQMIRDSLLPMLPRMEYREFACCGHEPWTEKQARDAFFAVLLDWLGRQAGP